MDTPVEEQQLFQNVTCTIAAAENEITAPNSLALEIINDVLFLSVSLSYYLVVLTRHHSLILSIHARLYSRCKAFVTDSDPHANVLSIG